MRELMDIMRWCGESGAGSDCMEVGIQHPFYGRTCQMMDRFGDHGLMGQDGIHRLPWMDGFTWCMSISSFPRRFRNGIGAPGGFPLLVFLFFF
ncbi:hypothetical protein VTJ04DRAFT_865 [Mycothermus thermophilus]|uniref:uncharacterized protein n=1 Tax=Humicola insolens TaxID=85995 RepID=UPI003742F661